MTLQLDPRPMLLGLVLQSNPLKFRPYKFNVIINIINITLGLGVATKPKTLGYNFAKKKNLIFLDFSFYEMQKIIDPRHRAGHVTSISLIVIFV